MRVIFELDDGTRLIHEVGGASPPSSAPQATARSGTVIASGATNGGSAPTARAGPSTPAAILAAAPAGPTASEARNAGPAPKFLAYNQPRGQTALSAARAATADAINAGAAPSSGGH
jgi:hypothetical protein